MIGLFAALGAIFAGVLAWLGHARALDRAEARGWDRAREEQARRAELVRQRLAHVDAAAAARAAVETTTIMTADEHERQASGAALGELLEDAQAQRARLDGMAALAARESGMGESAPSPPLDSPIPCRAGGGE